jgi:hypothetical protein
LFGVEGYVPLLEIEEMLFGLRLGRLRWSPHGSPLSRHRYRKAYRERTNEYEPKAGDVEEAHENSFI